MEAESLPRAVAHHRLLLTASPTATTCGWAASSRSWRWTAGIWPLYRFDPRRAAQGEPPLVIDVKPGKVPVEEYFQNETRFRMVEKIDPARYGRLAKAAKEQSAQRVALYGQLANIKLLFDANGSHATSASTGEKEVKS